VSSARSTSACRSRRSRTWSDASVRTSTDGDGIDPAGSAATSPDLDSIAFTIRERVRIQGEIRTLTAQQRLSGYVVGFLPIGLAAFLFIGAPGFMDPMFDNPPGVLGLPAGVIILVLGGFMMFLGFMAIRRIVDIEV
jgi:Flp pilus assembly protein TadB